MTDRPTPRVPRANPAPRRALPRVTPLGVGGGAPADGAKKAQSAGAGPEQEPEATGRDLLIPNGATQRRKGRGSATVPTLAELMPPERPAGQAKDHGKSHGGKDKHDAKHGEAKHADAKTADPKNAEAKDGKIKEVDLQVTLSKGLRKRLKAKAAEMGLAPEDAVAQLVEVWVDG
jgi:hypothetical protein